MCRVAGSLPDDDFTHSGSKEDWSIVTDGPWPLQLDATCSRYSVALEKSGDKFSATYAPFCRTLSPY